MATAMNTLPRKMKMLPIPSDTKKVPEFLSTSKNAFIAEVQKFLE